MAATTAAAAACNFHADSKNENTTKKGENIFHFALFSGGVAQDESEFEFEFGKGMTARVQGLPFASFNAVRTQLQPCGKSASSETEFEFESIITRAFASHDE